MPGRSRVCLVKHITKDQMETQLEMVESHGQLFLVKRKMALDLYMHSMDLLTEKINVKLTIKGKSLSLPRTRSRKTVRAPSAAFPLLKALLGTQESSLLPRLTIPYLPLLPLYQPPSTLLPQCLCTGCFHSLGCSSSSCPMEARPSPQVLIKGPFL